MTVRDDEDKRGTPLKELRHGRVGLRRYQVTDDQGHARQHFELTAPGGKSMSMQFDDFRSAVEVIRQMVQVLRQEREARQAAARSQEEPEKVRAERPRSKHDWHTVVEVERLEGDNRAQARVVKSFTGDTGFTDAQTHCAKNKGRNYCLYGEAFGAEPAEGTRLEVRRGQRPDIDRAMDQVRMGQERGKAFCMGVWYDRGSAPQVGQLVNFSTGIDYRELYEDRKVTPLRAVEPGQKGEPLYVIFEKNPSTPQLGRVVDVTRVRPDAVTKVKELDQQRQATQQASRRDALEDLSFNPKNRPTLSP